MATVCTSQGLCAKGHSETEALSAEKQTLQTANTPSLPVNRKTTLTRRLLDWMAIRRQRKLNRDAYRNLLSLSDELLADIGVTREQVRWAEKLPLDQNAALVLREVAQGGPHVSVAAWIRSPKR